MWNDPKNLDYIVTELTIEYVVDTFKADILKKSSKKLKIII